MTERNESVLLLVAVKTSQPEIQRRVKAILEAAWPDAPGQLWAKGVDELVAADLDRLAALIGWDAVRYLNIGDVAVSSSEKGG